MNIENCIYLTIIFLGFMVFGISILIINKHYKIMGYFKCLIFYLVAILFFIAFAKLIHIVLDCDISSINLILSNEYADKLNFIYSGYSFIGGYIGILIYLYFYKRYNAVEMMDLMTLLIPSILLMYSILKVGCYVKGCCYGKLSVPVQLIESFANFLAYLIIMILHKDKKKLVGYSFISFGLLRFLISLFRVFNSIYTLIFIELFCILLIFVGMNFLKIKKVVD